MYKPTYCLLCCLLICSSACETAAQRKEAALNKKAGEEIDRICSLPEPKRTAELNKIKEQSGMVLYCGGSQ